MVSFTSAAVLSLAAVSALAGPVEKRTGLWHHGRECMTDADAQQVVDNYAELIRAYSDELANDALTTDFTDYSESVNSLINTCPQGESTVSTPLLSPSFTSRKAFKIGQGEQPPIHFTQLNIMHDCKSVAVRWSTDNTAPIPQPRPVIGIIWLETERSPRGSKYPWKINTVYSEFDSAAWLQNLEEAGNICATENPSSPQLPYSGAPAPSATASYSAGPSAAASAPAYSSAASAPAYSSAAPSAPAYSAAPSAPAYSA